MIELTNKELEVLKMLSYPNRVIASRLKITEALLKRISTLYFIKSLIRKHVPALL